MIDLDSLAEKRAAQLQQDVAAWKSLLWSKDFQELSQSLSDGEIEKVLELCRSTGEVSGLLNFLKTHKSDGAPFQPWLEEQAKNMGKDLHAWLRSLAKS